MLFPCDPCGAFVFAGTACPHCSARAPSKVTRAAVAAMLLAGAGCPEPEYGALVTDTDGPPESTSDIVVEPLYGTSDFLPTGTGNTGDTGTD